MTDSLRTGVVMEYWSNVMRIEFEFDGGTPTLVRQTGERAVRCEPIATRSGSQWFYWCVRVDGLDEGEMGEVELVWPRKWTPEDLPDGLEDEIKHRMTAHDNFADVLPTQVHRGADMDHWTKVEGVEKVGERAVRVEIEGSGDPVYLTTQIPYLHRHHETLLALIDASEPGSVREIGQSQSGLPLRTVVLDTTGVDPGVVPTVYLQAYQHLTEFSGLHVLDAMLRFLVSPEGAACREKLNWQITPCVDMDGLHYGVAYHMVENFPKTHLRAKNPNRDWRDREWPEVVAVCDFLTDQVAGGRQYVAGLDLHNGWWKTVAPAACYTVFHEDEAEPDYIERQKDLIRHLYRNTDHVDPAEEHFWAHQTGGRTMTTAFKEISGGGLASTVEFSRFIWWDRAVGAYVPAEVGHPERFGRDLAVALADYFG